jgi:hypothetical protein
MEDSAQNGGRSRVDVVGEHAREAQEFLLLIGRRRLIIVLVPLRLDAVLAAHCPRLALERGRVKPVQDLSAR